MKYEPHEYANLFPMMSEADINQLAEDIRENGLMDPIVTLDGKILDGRNRYKACEIAEINPKWREYDGADPLAFVVAHNLHRRHLNESQRAMIAAKMAKLPRGNPNSSRDGIDKPVTQPEAAEMMNVSVPSITRAKNVITNAVSALQDMVDSGEVKVTQAALVATLPAEQQNQILTGGVAGVKEASKKLRDAKKASKPQEGSSNNLDSSAQEQDSSQDRSQPVNGVAMTYARSAMEFLNKMPKRDPSRKDAVKLIAYWVEQNTNMKKK